MDSSIIYSGSVFVEDLVDDHIIRVVAIEVLSASKNSVISSDSLNLGGWCLINTFCGESKVHVGSKCGIIEELLGVSGLILGSEVVKLVISHSEVHHGENALELVLGDTTLAELVKISEELFNAHSLHNNGSL